MVCFNFMDNKYNEYAIKILRLLKNYDIRGSIDTRNEKTGRKIRDAEIKKTPYMIIVGEKEKSSNLISVRKHGKGDLGTMEIKEFCNKLNNEISKELD